jgi:hypothetical protein
MGFWQSDVLSVAPRSVWLVTSLGIVLAADIAAALSLAFASLIFPPLSFAGSGTLLLVLGVIFFLVVVPVAGLLVGLPTWWLFVARPRQFTRWRGIALGMISGIVAHPLVWIGADFEWTLVELSNLTSASTSNLPSSPPEVFVPPISLFLVLPLSLISLTVVGWITVAVGGIAGGVLIYLQVELMRRLRQQDGMVSPSHG